VELATAVMVGVAMVGVVMVEVVTVEVVMEKVHQVEAEMGSAARGVRAGGAASTRVRGGDAAAVEMAPTARGEAAATGTTTSGSALFRSGPPHLSGGDVLDTALDGTRVGSGRSAGGATGWPVAGSSASIGGFGFATGGRGGGEQ
jgi:hypothetical protein